MTFEQFLRILRARFKIALGIFLLAVVGTLVGSMIFPKRYTAETTVLVDSRPDAVSSQQMMSAISAMSYLATQIEVIESPAVAQRVVRAMHLDTNEEQHQAWIKDTDGRGNFVAWLGDLMARGLKVKPSRESNVIEIDYEGGSPQFAAVMANAFAQAYIDASVQFRTGPARQYTEFFEERAKLAREKLEQAQTRLAAAQNDKGIIATDERLDVENLKLNDLSAQVSMLRSSRAEAQNRSRQAHGSPEESAEVVTSTLIASLKSDLALSEGKLQELLQVYGDNYPAVIQERANVADLRKKIALETQHISGSLAANSTIATNREAEISAAYDAQKEKLMKLKAVRTELSVLERDVDSAQKVYDALMLRLSQTNLEGNTSQAGVTILSPATEPSRPSSPKMLINIGVSMLVGALLAAIVSVVLELLDRRVRAGDDLQYLMGAPVLGVLPGPRPQRRALRLLNRASALR